MTRHKWKWQKHPSNGNMVQYESQNAAGENSSCYSGLLFILEHSPENLKRNKCLFFYPLLKSSSGIVWLFIILLSFFMLWVSEQESATNSHFFPRYTHSALTIYLHFSHTINTLYPFPHLSSSIILKSSSLKTLKRSNSLRKQTQGQPTERLRKISN